MPTEEEIREAFREFDFDENGLIDEKKIALVADKMEMKLTK